MRVIATVKAMQQTAEGLRKEKRVALVPTMGYLHEGHLSLVRQARDAADIVVASIFVNPIQFGPKEDLSRYPRDFERDAALLQQQKTDIIFCPDADEMYPPGYSTYIQVRGLEDHLCGLTREGHFTGVATVVAKLFNAVKPHLALFGQKDYQQLKVIERMVRDLNMDIEIIGCPTVREKDGLAMSSRNTYLSAPEREKALLLSVALNRVGELFGQGERSASVLKKEAGRVLTSEGGVDVEYVTICDAETLEDVKRIDRKAVLAIAARVGRTRLIDNTVLTDNSL
jgi:pantoate--beta-alanine ligase